MTALALAKSFDFRGQAHRFAELFEHLLQTDAPLLFLCTAGQDRSGVAAALILLTLGVPRDPVRQDFLLTTVHYRHPPPAAATRSPATRPPMCWRCSGRCGRARSMQRCTRWTPTMAAPTAACAFAPV